MDTCANEAIPRWGKGGLINHLHLQMRPTQNTLSLGAWGLGLGPGAWAGGWGGAWGLGPGAWAWGWGDRGAGLAKALAGAGWLGAAEKRWLVGVGGDWGGGWGRLLGAGGQGGFLGLWALGSGLGAGV